MINYKSYLIFLFASLAVSIGLQMILPFPYGLGAALALFIAFPLILRRRMMSRMRGGFGEVLVHLAVDSEEVCLVNKATNLE